MTILRRLAGSGTCVLALVVATLGTADVAAAAAPRPTSLPTASDVVVEVDGGAVDVEIEGWAKAKVEVDEDIAAGWTAHLEEDGARVRVRLDGPPGMPQSGTLKLRVPKGAELQVTTRGGDVRGA
jgi:hypothetical protein